VKARYKADWHFLFWK